MGIENLGKKLTQLGADTKSSVQKMSESYQLGAKVKEQKAELDKLFAAIGEKVFEADPETAPVGLEEIYTSVKQAKETLASYEEQRQKMNGVKICPECGKEAPEENSFCGACGAKLPERKAEEEIRDTLEKDVKEVAGEAGDFLNSAADKAKDLFNDVAEKADSFFKGVASKLSEAKDSAADAVGDAAEEAAEAAAEAADAAEEAAGEAAEAVEDAVQDVEDAAADVKEKVEAAAEQAEEAVAEAAEKTAEAVDIPIE